MSPQVKYLIYIHIKLYDFSLYLYIYIFTSLYTLSTQNLSSVSPISVRKIPPSIKKKSYIKEQAQIPVQSAHLLSAIEKI